MPKVKTNRTAYKKLKVSSKGRVKRAHANMSHNTAKKASKRKRRLSKMATLDKTNLNTAIKLLPNQL